MVRFNALSIVVGPPLLRLFEMVGILSGHSALSG